MRIGITGTGSLIGQAILKCIRLSELLPQMYLVGFDYFTETIGSYWCHKNYILPDFYKKKVTEKVWLDSLMQCITDENLEILFIGVDFELPLLANYQQEILEKTNCRVIVSDNEVIKIGNDKYLTYQFLKHNDLYYPETYLFAEFEDKINEIIEEKEINNLFPFIIKPRIGARSVGVSILKNINDFYEKTKNINKEEFIIQELVGDNDTEFTCGVLCSNDVLRGKIALKRTLKEGNTAKASFIKTQTPDILLEYIEKIAEKLKPNGVVNLQIRIDKMGIPKLFEINSRHSGTTYMRALLGYNEVDYLIRHHLGLPLSELEAQEGQVIRFYEEKLIQNL
jgi:carbamoyl-phosphate synthase large subunit